MGHIARLKEELEELAEALEDACLIPDVLQQPEVAEARQVVEEARTSVASAFLSRRSLMLAREAVERAQKAVGEAMSVSSLLRARSAQLRSQAEEARAAMGGRREASNLLHDWSKTLREAAVAGTPAQVVVESAIPAEHPAKAQIEAAIVSTLSAAAGEWKVWITVPSGPWWGLRVKGPAIDWVATLQDAAEQTPQAVAARLEPLVRVAQAESLYRRSRRIARGRSTSAD
jgi:hypothetical protein